jgi:hypothetical protein
MRFTTKFYISLQNRCICGKFGAEFARWLKCIQISQIKAAVPSTFVSITKAQKIKLVDVSLLSNCNNLIKPKTKIK